MRVLFPEAPNKPYKAGIIKMVVMMLLGTVAVCIAWSDELSSSAITNTVSLSVSAFARLQLSDDGPMVLTVNPGTSPSYLTDAGSMGVRRLYYTAINRPGKTRVIEVQWAQTDTAPPGTSLRIHAVNIPDGCGISAGEVTVSSVPQAVIYGIPSCATGTGDLGVELRYLVVVDDVSRILEVDRFTITVIYTISDDR